MTNDTFTIDLTPVALLEVSDLLSRYRRYMRSVDTLTDDAAYYTKRDQRIAAADCKRSAISARRKADEIARTLTDDYQIDMNRIFDAMREKEVQA